MFGVIGFYALVGSQLLLGGSAVVTSLTGMNVYAAIFLIRKTHPYHERRHPD